MVKKPIVVKLVDGKTITVAVSFGVWLIRQLQEVQDVFNLVKIFLQFGM